MALLSIIGGDESGEIRPGDVVFSHNPQCETYPLHVGIYIGSALQRVRNDSPEISIDVCSLPGKFQGRALGIRSWPEADNISMTERYRYVITMVGQRLDVEVEIVEQVALLAKQSEFEHSHQGNVHGWGWTLQRSATADPLWQTPGGRPVFTHGTCAQFVEFLYEQVGLDLVDQRTTCRPAPEPDIHPATQMHAFWRGVYPLSEPWQDYMGKYPECLQHHEGCFVR